MPLTAGSRIGPLVIEALVGAGGMGEVYRARDTRLGRDVALKVLPASVAADPERLERFAREARVLASLNHPNIAQVHGVLDEPAALIMELVEGEDLAQRLARGPMPVEEVIPAARQIAEALEAAHESGIVHRDLKPANIKVRPDDTIKVLDFGLAKALDPVGSSIDPMQSPTLTARATQLGTIVGTAAYMAPEQARGKVVDRRADIWAFGCVVFEMLTGEQLFVGESISETLSAVLRDEPDWTRLPAATPATLRALLARCLEKDPKQRLRDIGEARLTLAYGQRPASGSALALSGPAARKGAAWRLWIAVTLALAAAAGALGYFSRPVPPEVRVRKSFVAVQQDGSAISMPVLSPDGSKVVYQSRSRLWVQPLDDWTPRELVGTEGGTRPFWSQSGDWIAFFRSEQLLKVPAAGGPVTLVTRLPAVQAPLNASSGIWTADGTLIISMAAGLTIYQVPSGGGELRNFFTMPAGLGLDLHDIAPLPGGAIVAALHRESGTDALGVVHDGRFEIVLEASDVRRPQYSPSGHLVFARQAPNDGLWAVPFSAGQRRVTGEPFLIAGGSQPTVAGDGTLLYRAAREALPRQLSWFTMEGVIGEPIAPPQDWIEGVALSPDGRRIVTSAEDGIWAYDIASGARSRLTTGRADITPQWVGTTDQIVFVRSSGGRSAIIIKRADPSGEERVLVEDGRFPSFTRDGRRLVFNQRANDDTPWQVAWIDLDKPTEIHRLAGAHVGARFPAVSSDGKLVAYVSGEIGRDEIFVTRLPDGNGKWQVSNDGGGWCRFSGPGDGVVYRAPGGDFMSVPITTGEELTLGRPRKLFEWGPGWLPFYELTPDGTRGIAAIPATKTAGVATLSLVQNWHVEFANGR